ncbi:MAG: peptide chain release factor N(5)-glutamine methyltransferase [Desulfobacterales bacterium]|jgi:release factor glutamine methyltransferase|nr:peptide chain release factor N(5)-glutamine methyltransferase [Desulfobacterales bacterium]
MQKSPTDSTWTILKIIQWATAYFKSNHIDSPRLTIEILLSHVLGVERIDLYLSFDKPLNAEELALIKTLIKRRLNREPVAYITGKKEFFGLEFDIAPGALIPRPETEFLVEEALKFIPESAFAGPMRILDIGTGSGAIIVSIAKHRPYHVFFASDISQKALTIACGNAKKFFTTKIHFFAADWLSPITLNSATFDIIVSNPPYIPADEIAHLAPEINEYEPAQALDGGSDGMNAIRTLLGSVPAYLKSGGRLLLEIGHDQKDQVCKETGRCPSLILEKFIRDYGGHDRVAVIQKVK